MGVRGGGEKRTSSRKPDAGTPATIHVPFARHAGPRTPFVPSTHCGACWPSAVGHHPALRVRRAVGVRKPRGGWPGTRSVAQMYGLHESVSTSETGRPCAPCSASSSVYVGAAMQPVPPA
jgi:hypothetical protein